LIDNHIYWGNKLQIDVRRVSWKRCVDLNDRSLRSIVADLGGVANGYPESVRFVISKLCFLKNNNLRFIILMILKVHK
jgi:formate--tetrahydrofolate ligase